MSEDFDVAVAIEFVERKIAGLNVKIANGQVNKEVKEQLEKYLEMKKEIYNGNMLVVKEIFGQIEEE